MCVKKLNFEVTNNTSLWWLQVKGVPKVLYSLRMHWVGCFYWNKQYKDWFSDGCELTDQKSDTIVSCRYTRVVITWTTCVVNTFYPTLYTTVTKSWFLLPIIQLQGSFCIDDGNGSENVGFKMNSRFFNLCRVYSNLLKIASVGKFPWSWFLEELIQV